MPLLSPYELDITREIISMGLANAADSFSKMASEQVMIHEYDLQFIQKEALSSVLSSRPESHWYVLTTDVVGKLEAKSYLLFNQSDMEKALHVFLPGRESVEGGNLSELQAAVMLELDNIVTAAMVTQLSNFLGLFIYGDVPNLKHLFIPEMVEYFEREIEHYDVILHVQARFQSYQTNMSPVFICFFKSEFLLAIKQLVEQKRHLSLVKK